MGVGKRELKGGLFCLLRTGEGDLSFYYLSKINKNSDLPNLGATRAIRQS